MSLYAWVADGAETGRRQDFDMPPPPKATGTKWLPVVVEMAELGPGQRYAAMVATVEAERVLESYAAEDIPLEALRATRLEAIRDRRWTAETGGITVGGVPIRTDEKSQAKIAGAVSLFDNDPTLLSVAWEAQPGVFADLDEATVRGVGVAVGRHVQACFANSKALTEAVQAAEDAEAVLAVDIEAGWPSC